MRKSQTVKPNPMLITKLDHSIIERIEGIGLSQLPVKRNGIYCKSDAKEKREKPAIISIRLGKSAAKGKRNKRYHG